MGDAADQAKPGRTALKYRLDEAFDMQNRVLDDGKRDFISRFGAVQHQRGEGGVVARAGGIHPGDDTRNGVIETPRHHGAEWGGLGPAVQRPQGMAHGAEPQCGAAAFVGDWKAVAADGERDAADRAIADAAGPQNQYRPIGAAMGPQIGDGRVAGELSTFERKIAFQKLLFCAGAGEAGNAQASRDPFQIGRPPSRRLDRLFADIDQGLAQTGDADAGVAGAGSPLPDHYAAGRHQPGAAIGAAGVDSQISDWHGQLSQSRENPASLPVVPYPIRAASASAVPWGSYCGSDAP